MPERDPRLSECSACRQNYDFGDWAVRRCAHFDGMEIHWHQYQRGGLPVSICGPQPPRQTRSQNTSVFHHSLADAEDDFLHRAELLRLEETAHA